MFYGNISSIVNKFYIHILIEILTHEGVWSSVKERWLGEFGQGTCNEYIVVIERVVLTCQEIHTLINMWISRGKHR
jgi:hypothetical protein